MLELTKEIDEEAVKEWSDKRLKAEMEETEISDLTQLALGFGMGLIIFFLILSTLSLILSTLATIYYILMIFVEIILLGLIVFTCWYFYKRDKRYKELRKLWKVRL